MGVTHDWLSLGIKELLLLGLLGILLSGEVLVVELLQSLNTGEIDLGGSGDDVSGVDSAEWDTVDLEWAADEEETVGEWLEVDNTLSTESASEDDEDGSWLKRRTEVGWSLCLTGLFSPTVRFRSKIMLNVRVSVSEMVPLPAPRKSPSR